MTLYMCSHLGHGCPRLRREVRTLAQGVYLEVRQEEEKAAKRDCY